MLGQETNVHILEDIETNMQCDMAELWHLGILRIKFCAFFFCCPLLTSMIAADPKDRVNAKHAICPL